MRIKSFAFYGIEVVIIIHFRVLNIGKIFRIVSKLFSNENFGCNNRYLT